MTDDAMAQLISHLLASGGPSSALIIGLLLIIKYLLDKDKQRETAHKVELEAERQRTREERTRGDALQMELLAEARGNAMLGEELKKALQALVEGRS